MKKRILFFLVGIIFCAATAFAQAQSNAPANWWRIVTPATAGVDAEVAALPQTIDQNIKMPILIGVAPGSFAKNYGITYSNGSVHQGQDIFAPRGAYVVSPTVAVVTRVDLAGAGGIAVYTANPGQETFYYAHLTAVGPTIHVGAQLQSGDLIGYVGNTGDAEGASTHLHFQIFDKDVGVVDPNPRLTQTFSEDERIMALNNITSRSSDRQLAANAIVKLYKSFLTTLSANHSSLAPELVTALSGVSASASPSSSSSSAATQAPVQSVQTQTIQPVQVVPTTPSVAVNASTTTSIASTNSTTQSVQTQTQAQTPIQITAQTTPQTLSPAPTPISTTSMTAPTPAPTIAAGTISQNLIFGMRNDDVKFLQQYLINHHVGVYGQTLAQYGPTGYYGILTKVAVIEFQRSVGLSGSGYCGPLTRAYIASHS